MDKCFRPGDLIICEYTVDAEYIYTIARCVEEVILNNGMVGMTINLVDTNDEFFDSYDKSTELVIQDYKHSDWELYEGDIVPASVKEIEEFLFGGYN